MRKNVFTCLKCGLCCRHIGGIEQLSDFDNGEGVCMHLMPDNLCDIYSTRPIWCNVENLYAKMFADKMTEAEWNEANRRVCEQLIAWHEKNRNMDTK